jgi:hypothetical protein
MDDIYIHLHVSQIESVNRLLNKNCIIYILHYGKNTTVKHFTQNPILMHFTMK